MDPKVMFAVETGVEKFLESADCSESLRKKVAEELSREEFRGQHFHDLAGVLIATLSSFIAGLAANIASAYFQKKHISDKEAEKVAADAAEVRRNEMRLRLGEAEAEKCTVSKAEIASLGRHMRDACEKVKE